MLWADFGSAPYYAAYEPKTVRNYFRGDFVEVFVNDEYMGIYSLNEHMDRQQMKLKQYDYEKGEFHGGLWKPMQLTSTTLFKELPAFDATSKNWDEFVIKYPNIDDVTPTNYQTLHDAIYFTMNSTDAEFLDSAEYYFDIPVFRDYYLFTILMQAPDNYGKNLYYACYDVATDPRLTIGIWDLDCIWVAVISSVTGLSSASSACSACSTTFWMSGCLVLSTRPYMSGISP